jgi:hypothetical protein
VERGAPEVRDVVVFGGHELGTAIARALVEKEIRVRVVEGDEDRASLLAARGPAARVFCATGLDPAFLRREGIERTQAAIFAMRDTRRTCSRRRSPARRASATRSRSRTTPCPRSSTSRTAST